MAAAVITSVLGFDPTRPLLALAGYANARSSTIVTYEDPALVRAPVTADLDLSRACRPAQEHRRVNVDFPAWMIQSLDREAGRLGGARWSVIKVRIAERLDRKVS